MTKSLQIFEH